MRSKFKKNSSTIYYYFFAQLACSASDNIHMMMAVNEQDLNTDLKVYNTVQKSKLPEKREPVFQVLLFVTANHQKRDEFSFKSNLSAVRATQKNEIRSFNLNFQKYEKKTAFKERCDQNLRKIPA